MKKSEDQSSHLPALNREEKNRAGQSGENVSSQCIRGRRQPFWPTVHLGLIHLPPSSLKKWAWRDHGQTEVVSYKHVTKD